MEALLQRLGPNAMDKMKLYIKSALAQDLLSKDHASPSFPPTLVDALCADHLSRRGCSFTVSVLSSELSGVTGLECSQEVGRFLERLRTMSSYVKEYSGEAGGEDEGVGGEVGGLITPPGGATPTPPSGLTSLVHFLALVTSALPHVDRALERARDTEATLAALEAERAQQEAEGGGSPASIAAAPSAFPLDALAPYLPVTALAARRLAEVDARLASTLATHTYLPTTTTATAAATPGGEDASPIPYHVVSAMVSAAEARVEARVRGEEGLKLEATVARVLAEAEVERVRCVTEATRGALGEAKLLSNAREAAVAGADALRERLVMDLEGAAAREAGDRRAHALDVRAAAMERAEWEASTRTLLSRVREAEDAAMHAKARASLAIEKARGEWELRQEEREARVRGEEARVRRERGVLEEERARFAGVLEAAPGLAGAAAGAEARLAVAVAEAGAAREGKRVAKAGWEEAKGVAAAAVAVRRELEGALKAGEESKGEWAAALRVLRNRLALASDRLASERSAAVAAKVEWEDRLARAVEREKGAAATASAAWAAERARLSAEAQGFAESASKEARRADELEAQLAGCNARLDEAKRTLGEVRARGGGGGGGRGVEWQCPWGGGGFFPCLLLFSVQQPQCRQQEWLGTRRNAISGLCSSRCSGGGGGQEGLHPLLVF